jgi:SAM-dependent methyltransferase
MRQACPVCQRDCALLDVVDFNKTCEEARGKFLPPAGVAISYFRCRVCGFTFAPELCAWTLEEFEARIYNADYALVDPDYLDVRPRANAASLVPMLGERARTIRHLDFGGGNGLLSRLLREAGWPSTSYDPFVDRDVSLAALGRFDLITAFEVFEHVPDVQRLMSSLTTLLAPDGVVLFSTMASDGHLHPGQRIEWWYAAPRNGHISLYSRKSLDILAEKHGLEFGSFNEGFHAYFRTIPDWAAPIFRP